MNYFRLFVMFLLLALMLTGCEDKEIAKYENEEVVCYRVVMYQGISCFLKRDIK